MIKQIKKKDDFKTPQNHRMTWVGKIFKVSYDQTPMWEGLPTSKSQALDQVSQGPIQLLYFIFQSEMPSEPHQHLTSFAKSNCF